MPRVYRLLLLLLMLVYGDAARVEDPRRKATRIRAGMERLHDVRSPIGRHALLAELLVEAGELEQGLLDRQLESCGEERPSSLREAASRLTRAVAGAFVMSFRALDSQPGKVVRPPVEAALDALLALDLPQRIEVVLPEGFAIYGLYPETYAWAVEVLAGRPLRVIGIRSIGTALAAVVAAAAGERASAISVRPTGHPFDRRLVVGEELSRDLLADPAARYAVVDEGPGLSGSSFGCVADWLQDRGVASEAISFFPSHRGEPGRYANERHRRRWQRARHHVVEFEEVFTSADSRWPLARWVQDLIGPAEAPLEDLSAGRWRERLIPERSRWPAADVRAERRKYLQTAAGRPWLLKFAGLGGYGREKLEMAQALAEAGLIPPIAGLRHGFLVGPWLSSARPLPLLPEVDRPGLFDAVARYLAFRIERFPVRGERGATPEKLLEMAAFNTHGVLGAGCGEAVEEWRGRLPEIARLERPILSDNKMQAWEWLVMPDGTILKADALDHHRANDLVGPQDPAWDLAGAAVELDLDGDELDFLADVVARRSRTPRAEPVQLGFYTVAYLAFHLGRHTLAAEASTDPAESVRLRCEMERYAARLRQALDPQLSQCALNSRICASVSS
jgi:hypothetical protein